MPLVENVADYIYDLLLFIDFDNFHALQWHEIQCRQMLLLQLSLIHSNDSSFSVTVRQMEKCEITTYKMKFSLISCCEPANTHAVCRPCLQEPIAEKHKWFSKYQIYFTLFPLRTYQLHYVQCSCAVVFCYYRQYISTCIHNYTYTTDKRIEG